MTLFTALMSLATGVAIAFLVAAPLSAAYLLLARWLTRKPFKLGSCAAHRLGDDEPTIRLPTNLIGGTR